MTFWDYAAPAKGWYPFEDSSLLHNELTLLLTLCGGDPDSRPILDRLNKESAVTERAGWSLSCNCFEIRRRDEDRGIKAD